MIVDEFTGRLMPDRRYSDGLHQALEAKEGLSIQRESQTLASITLQHYFQLYNGLCGMTGTAKTEEEEFKQIYGLPVLIIPTNRTLQRQAMPDVIYRSEKTKFAAIADHVEALHEQGRPILIGTNSIEKSEYLSKLLNGKKLPHHVLNAKYHEKEAEIVAQAGQRGAITVATNMAGRGTDIKLEDGVPELGGLMDRFGMAEGEAIEHDLLSGGIRRAQKRVEGRNFEIRKRLLEYDLVLAKQREAIYALRDRFLLPPRAQQEGLPEAEQADLFAYLHDLFAETGENLVNNYALPNRPRDEWNLDGLAKELAVYGRFNDTAAEDLSHSELIEAVVEHLRQALDAQSRRLGKPFPVVARYLIVRTLDEAWRTHLYTLDDLKGGIGWTALAGTDPLVAFKRESFSLFQAMLGRTAEKLVRILLDPRLTVTGERAAHGSAPQGVQYVRPEAMRPNVSSTAPGARPRPVSRAERPGRNDPCPCGSGKKYKKCCGKDQ